MAGEAQAPTTKGPRSIYDVLATLPSGKPGIRLEPSAVGAYLSEHYNGNLDKDREKRHALREELYRDGGVREMENWIEQVFKDKAIQDLRKKCVRNARFTNPMRRIVNTLATVYTEPARRFVGELSFAVGLRVLVDAEQSEGRPAGAGTVQAVKGTAVAIEFDSIPNVIHKWYLADEVTLEPVDPSRASKGPRGLNNERYQTALELARMDERALEFSRLLELHRALLIGFRVREKPDGTREPVIDIASPANARPVYHPNDNTLIVGWLVRTCYRSARSLDAAAMPVWTLWTDYESVQLNADMRPIDESYEAHKLGVCPWVPIQLGSSWTSCEGEDLVAAQLTTWLAHVLLVKETKSATTTSVLQGDSTRLARGQAMESENVVELPEGTSMTTIDPSMDLSMFRDTADHVLQHAGLNYGLPPRILNHEGVQSAEARELMLIPLRELRRQRQLPLRRFEHRFAIVMAAVLANDMPELSFAPDEFRIEFAENETPLDPLKEHELFEKRRAAGLDNSIEFMKRQRPGLTDEQAWAEIQTNITVETQRNAAMRPLAAIAGSLKAGVPTIPANGAERAGTEENQQQQENDNGSASG